MALNWSTAYGAASVQDALRQMAQDRIAQQMRDRAILESDRNFGLHKQQLDAEQARATAQDQELKQLHGQSLANQVADELTPGQSIGAKTADMLSAGGRGDLVKENPEQAMPAFLRMASTQPDWVPGEQPGTVYQGTAGQQFQRSQAEANAEGRRQADARQQRTDERLDAQLKETNRHNQAVENKPTAPAVMTVQTVDADGNPVTKVVPKTAGAEYAKGPNATVGNRLASAKAVNQTGNDIIAKLSDPAYVATVGPLMGRAGTLRNFIGNPPPEFADLAGQIESYALANMGVHGMRSTQGAEQIKKLLDTHHTPESLIATIKGLNSFSEHFIANETPKSKTGGAGAGEIQARDPQGVLHKAPAGTPLPAGWKLEP